MTKGHQRLEIRQEPVLSKHFRGRVARAEFSPGILQRPLHLRTTSSDYGFNCILSAVDSLEPTEKPFQLRLGPLDLADLCIQIPTIPRNHVAHRGEHVVLDRIDSLGLYRAQHGIEGPGR